MNRELQVQLTRAGIVESSHRVLAVVTDRHGNTESWGDPSRPTIARSAIKSVQAIPLITSGAADAFDLRIEELALACASHSAEQAQVDVVQSWLERIGLDEDALECGADPPIGLRARRALIASGEPYGRIHNGCSGKHTGYLSVAVHNGWPTAGYSNGTSPVQQEVTTALSAFVGIDLHQHDHGVDGCGVPVFAVPAWRLALAMARLVDPEDLDPQLAAATERIVPAAQQAYWVSGPNRTEVVVSENALEPVVIKGGAEGVYMVALPQRSQGMVVKALDGTSRASNAAVRALLQQMGVIDLESMEIPMHNKQGTQSGVTRVSIPSPTKHQMASG